jgi:hypothetical protein
LRIRAKIKIGDLVEALGCNSPEQEINISNSTLRVNTPKGYQKILGVRKTKELPIVRLETERNILRCATEHRVETSLGFQFVTEAKDVFTKNGFQVCKIITENIKENCYDVQIENTHSYWANEIHSHNSIFLANWAVATIKQGFNALVYTLEISEERLSMRHDAILTKIHVDELIYDIDKIKEKYKNFAKISKANLWVKEFPTKLASINTLRSHFEQLYTYEDFRPDVIFVDYAALLKPSFRVDSYEDLKAIYEELRGWAVELDIPIVTAAQTNRTSLDPKGGTKEIITQAQVADSLGIAQTVDLFMTITQSRTEKEQGTINLYIDKHRHGESSKTIKYYIDYKNFILDEIAI